MKHFPSVFRSDGTEAVSELDTPAVEELDGVCKTSEWGPWSECSVTCGIGVNTRRRYFLNRMGQKKCPLVQIGEATQDLFYSVRTPKSGFVNCIYVSKLSSNL